jgi:hypothetical protein
MKEETEGESQKGMKGGGSQIEVKKREGERERGERGTGEREEHKEKKRERESRSERRVLLPLCVSVS